MVALPQSVSLAEFMALPNDGNRHEYVRGEVRSMPPPKAEHGLIEGIIYEEIARHLRERALALGWQPEQGRVARHRLVGMAACGEFGMRISLPDDSQQIRGADCVYVPAEQFAQVAWDVDAYFPGVPWLVVEVISPSDTAADVAERVQDYLGGGAGRVWCVYPQKQIIQVHAVDRPMRFLRKPDILTEDELLPGFSLPLTWLF